MLQEKCIPFPFFARWIPTPLDISCAGGVYLGRDLHAIDDVRLKRFNLLTRCALALAVFSTGVGMRWRGIDINFEGLERYLATIVLLFGLSLFFTYRLRNPVAAAVTTIFCELMIMPVAITCFTYMATAFGGPDQTALIVSWDHSLGFDWSVYRAGLQSLPLAEEILDLAYVCFYVQIFAVPWLLFVCGYPAHTRLLLNCAVLGVIIVMFVATLFPTVDALLWYKEVAVDARGYTGLPRIDHMLMLRDGSMKNVSIWEMTGILCFPSFHVVAGCLFVGFTPRLGPARFAFVALNALMIAGTPRWGGHHLADVLAGIAIGVGLIAAALAYTRRRPDTGKICGLP